MSTNSEPVSGGGAISDEELAGVRNLVAAWEGYEGRQTAVTARTAAALIARLDASEARAEVAEVERDEAVAEVERLRTVVKLASGYSAGRYQSVCDVLDKWHVNDPAHRDTAIRAHFNYLAQPTPSPEEE